MLKIKPLIFTLLILILLVCATRNKVTTQPNTTNGVFATKMPAQDCSNVNSQSDPFTDEERAAIMQAQARAFEKTANQLMQSGKDVKTAEDLKKQLLG
jgi:hypothetical protein